MMAGYNPAKHPRDPHTGEWISVTPAEAQQYAAYLPAHTSLDNATMPQLVVAVNKGKREQDAINLRNGFTPAQAQEAAAHLPDGVSLSEATPAQIRAAIRKQKRLTRWTAGQMSALGLAPRD